MNTQLPSIALKKKHNLEVFNNAHEAVSSGFVQTGHIEGNHNACHIMTRSLSPIDFYKLTGYILYNRSPKENDK